MNQRKIDVIMPELRGKTDKVGTVAASDSKPDDFSSKSAFQPELRTMRVVIAGGGTGGHLFPGIAIAEAFMAKNPKNRVLFVSTGNPFEISVLSKTDFELAPITAEGIKGRGLRNQFRSMLKIPRGIFESIRILGRFKPDIVMGVGSYASGPVAAAAWLLGIKIVLHEQNILPGITNRMLACFADRIYVSFEKTKGAFNPEKICFSGNPVRKEILESARDQKTVTGDRQRPFTSLILGGSQGAHPINLALVEAIEHIRDRNHFFFAHQTGAKDETMVRRAYQDKDISCEVKPFFTDMALQYRRADLVIGRAGATTVAELTATGKAVIFIPYPFAADNHQVLNARTLTEAGAAEMILQKDLTGRALWERIEHYASHPKSLELLKSRAKAFGKPEAADVIVEDCYRLASGG
jgi:UDP-N-acetylglucosamine--N-acetylmuramyl-(pentapeptide) pyrophosphoryl-undecaprenol N-acetylglucosamine transferase